MKQLLNIEYSKVKNYTTFWVILSIYLVVVPLSFLGISSIQLPPPIVPEVTDLYGFPGVWNYITYSASIWNILLGVLVVIITCNELRFRTQRQNIIDGLSRRQLILSKFGVVIMLSIFATLYTFVIGFVFGSIYSDAGDVFQGIGHLGAYFLQTIGYFSFALVFALLVKQPALAIIFYVLVIPLRYVFNLTMGNDLAQYMPFNAIAELIPFPFFKEIIDIQASNDPNHDVTNFISQSARVSISLGWILLFVLGGYQVLRSRDL
ncbi:MAG: ABC transporter permease [Crocinitomicaceae bacterium]|nr:ABC transporter permease [Crocinitomicaceae bacterium]